MFSTTMFPLTALTKSILNKKTVLKKNVLGKNTLTKIRLATATALQTAASEQPGSTLLRQSVILRRKTLLTLMAAGLLTCLAGCSTVERVIYRPDIDQGNYLVSTDVAKLHTGMTQQQVVFTLGTPLLTDPFGSNTWYYIFRQQPGHQAVKQQTLTLTFSEDGILTNIENKPQLAKN